MTASLAQPELTTARCDRCGAPARARVLLPSGGELFFCGHHAHQHQRKLRELAAELPGDWTLAPGIPTTADP